MTILLGKTSMHEILPVKIDTSGRLVIASDTPSTLYPENKTSFFTNLSLAAGISVQTVVTVPAGELWRMTCFTMSYAGTVAGVTITARVNDLTNNLPFYTIGPPGNGTPNTILVNLLLSAGWNVNVRITGATLNDDFTGIVFAERIA